MRVAAGTLLAAWPDLLDPNFMHSVVLMCQHDDEGAFGFIVNRRTELLASAVLASHPVLGRVDLPLYQGGPVEPRRLQFLHTLPDEIPGGLALTSKVWVGGDIEAAAEWLVARKDEPVDSVSRRLRLLLGFSGWAPGQLETELRTGSWLPAPIAPETVLESVDGEAAWRMAVRSAGHAGRGLEDLPPDVSWN